MVYQRHGGFVECKERNDAKSAGQEPPDRPHSNASARFRTYAHLSARLKPLILQWFRLS